MTQKVRQRQFRMIPGLVAALTVCLGFGVHAEVTLDDIFAEVEEMNKLAQESQSRIVELENERSAALNEYREVLRSIDGQRVYNRQLSLVVQKQEDVIDQLEQDIEDIDSVQRNIVPLMLRMIESLDDFVRLDMPFLKDEREERVQALRELMDEPEVSKSEKFAQILRAYQIESEYGRTMDSYQDDLEIDGKTYFVKFLRVGRIALLYQTQDSKLTGWWNTETEEWEALPGSYTTPIKNGIKMAEKTLTPGLFKVPVVAPPKEN